MARPVLGMALCWNGFIQLGFCVCTDTCLVYVKAALIYPRI